MHFQRFVIAAIVLPLAIAAPIANTAAENKNSQVIQKDDKYDARGCILISHPPCTTNSVDNFGSLGLRACCRWDQWCACGTRAQVNEGARNCALAD
ncbi:hypothetical protein EAE99_001859 [Botrytis elliptica]|nr:hypothetical protein EAE99_001859 [Botrytis elliptica]